MKAKEEMSRSTSALDSLIVGVSESRPFSSNFVRRSLVVVCPSASLAGLVSSSSCNNFSWFNTVLPWVAESQIPCSTQFALHVTTGGEFYLEVSMRRKGLMRFKNSFSLYLNK